MTDATPRGPSSRWRGAGRVVGTRRSRDPLTGLATREQLLRRGPAMLAASQAQDRVSALLLLDIDGFKLLNDTVGHHAGDAVLVEVAHRLETVATPGDLVVRLGGDEFALLLTGLVADGESERRAQAVVDALVEPVPMDDLQLSPRASVGLAVHDYDGETVDQLLRAADQAMYAAKATSPGHWRAASDVAERRPGHATRLLADLRADPDARQVVVHYQPQVDARSGEVTGYEGLARWAHPDLGILPARQFVPLAERSGLMPAITASVLGQALGAVTDLTTAAPGSVLALNVTRRHLLVRGLVDDLVRQLHVQDIDPAQVVLEIAEPIARASGATLELFGALHRAGFGVSVRGFGSADTSLAALWSNPAVVEIKIDPSLVARVVDDVRAGQLARAMTSAAHDLGLRVVAVGVGDQAAADRLTDLGCDALQGFAIAPPDTLEATVAWVGRWRRGPAD